MILSSLNDADIGTPRPLPKKLGDEVSPAPENLYLWSTALTNMPAAGAGRVLVAADYESRAAMCMKSYFASVAASVDDYAASK